jgi:hypothetical protein
MKHFNGNSGSKFISIGNFVIKSTGFNKTSWKNQTQFLKNCKHPNFIKVIKIGNFIIMRYIPQTYTDYIINSPIDKCISSFENLLNIINNFDGKFENIDLNRYLSKLEKRVSYKFNTNISIPMKWGFNHGDLTFSNILYKNDDFVFIDPRGLNESIYYDYGKLLQSLVMKYENLLEPEIYPLTLLENKYNILKDILYKNFDDFLLNFYLAVHLIGAYPFLKQNNREYTNIFLEKGLKMFKELGIEYIKI